MPRAADTGYTAALRQLRRTAWMSLGVAHDICSEKDRHELVYQETFPHKGDMFAKRPVESKTRTYHRRVASGRTAGWRGRVGQDCSPIEVCA